MLKQKLLFTLIFSVLLGLFSTSQVQATCQQYSEECGPYCCNIGECVVPTPRWDGVIDYYCSDGVYVPLVPGTTNTPSTTPTPPPVSNTAPGCNGIGCGWQEVNYCDKSRGYQSFGDSASLVQSPFNDASKFFSDANYANYCVNLNAVGALTDYKNGLVDTKDVAYCEIGYVNARKSSDEGKSLIPNICCPAKSPYGVPASQYHVQCCATTGSSLVNGLCPGTPDSNPEEGEAGAAPAKTKGYLTAMLADTPSPDPFPAADKRYSCPPTSCLLQGTNPVPATVKRTMVTSSDINRYGCYTSIGSDDILLDDVPNITAGSSLVCYNGEIISESELKQWGSLLNLYNTCKQIDDATEQTNCLNCYKLCQGNDSCPLVYNSLGCIDTEPSGLITRVFQIGIGIFGGVGMLRIMQAAIMRQSGDPSKIQESYDIISSAIIGFILLLAGIVILRFIGINVLQIVPFDFLQ